MKKSNIPNYLIKQVDFNNQYNTNYLSRYEKLNSLIKLEDTDVTCCKVAEATDKSFIKGVLFLNSKKKKSIFNKECEIDLDPTSEEVDCYLDEKSSYWVEDFTGRTDIIFNPMVKNIFKTTGCVLGFVGKEDNGVFYCDNLIFPETAKGNCRDVKFDRKILILTNLLINTNYEKILPILDFCIDQIDDIIFIGTIFDQENNEWEFSRFKRIINKLKGKFYIIPGKNDPTSYLLPQNPLHSLLFDKNDKIIRLTNPGQVEIEEKTFIFVDYQKIVKDLMKYKENSTALSALELIAKSRQMCPAAPDTLPSIPFEGTDPFFIEKLDFLIAGGNEKVETKIFENKFLMAVPDFSLTQTAVLLNMKDLTYEEIKIDL